MKKIIFISLIVLLVSCEKNRKEIKYYPSLLDHKEKVDFKNNYKSFVEEVIKLSHNDKKPYIELKNKNIIRKIFLYVRGNVLIKERNIVNLSSDSIFTTEKGYKIKMLASILEKHYLNDGKSYFYLDSPDKALVEISLKKHQTKQDLENVLEKLTSEFDKLNLKIKKDLELYVFLDYFSLLAPPPSME